MALTIALVAGAAAAAIALALVFWPRTVRDRVSEFGKYAGYSEARYDGTVRLSDYLTMPDGTRLAYDLLLPTLRGKAAGERLPTLFKYTPYLRTWTIFDAQGHNLIADFIELSWAQRAYLRVRYWLAKDGRLFDPLFRTPWLKPLILDGYAVLIVERPGTGASFGVINGSFEASAQEIDVLLNWIAAQPWSDGKVGMFGDSFQAMVQIAAAGTGNPHLKAIFPASVPIELYDDIEYRGGVFSTAFTTFFAGAAAHLETLATPVDRDADGALLAKARKERAGATFGERVDLSSPAYSYRDSLTPSGRRIWDLTALYAFVERINRSGVAVYATFG
jgi:putative CocE/NonD family hydrolase